MKKGKTYGAKSLIKTLETLGVKVIFGYPGGANLPIYEALQNSSIQHILARHEQGAAHMADGYARATGEVGVCLATSGPGATNLVTGIATAYMDSSPVLAITGQVPSQNIGTDAFQEVDISGITIPITKHNMLIQDPLQIPSSIEEAFHLCSTGRKGPVLVDIPKDILKKEFQLPPRKEIVLEGYNPTSVGHPGQIKRAVKLLQQSKKPLIIAGGGIPLSGAFKELSDFVEKSQIPLIHTLMGKGALADTDPLNMGMCGYHGQVVANRAIAESDVILALGARFSNRHTIDLDTYPGHKKLIHIDIDPAEIGKNVETLLPVVGDVKNILKELIRLIHPIKTDQWLRSLRDIRANQYRIPMPKEGLNERFVIDAFQDYFKNPIVVSDVGRHQMFAAHGFLLGAGRNFLSSGGLGTMGFALPAAIGVAFGEVKQPILAVIGDGSFMMNPQELVVAAEHNLNLIIILMNDSLLGMIAQLQDEFYNNQFDISQLGGQTDFVMLAKSMGIQGHRVDSQRDLQQLLQSNQLQEGCHLVDCVISHLEHAYPMVKGRSITDIVEGRV